MSVTPWSDWHERWQRPTTTMLGEVLRQARERRGWSMRRANRETGMAFSTLSRLESGERSVASTVRLLARIADSYRMTTQERVLLIEAAGYKLTGE